MNFQKRTLLLVSKTQMLTITLCLFLATAYSQGDAYTITINDVSFEDGSITGYSGTATDIIIPEKLDGQTVTEIGEYAFESKNLTGVVLPDGITELDDQCFYDNKLENVGIPDNVTHIGLYAFANNSSLTSLTIGASVLSIDDWAFQDCGLLEVTIPDNVEHIGRNCFSYNNISNIQLGSSLLTIGEAAFGSNRGTISSLTIPNSVISIAAYAFYGNQLTSLELGTSVNSIGENAFSGHQLSTITLPNSVASIDKDAFKGNNITFINLPTDYLGKTYTWNNVAFNGGDQVPVDQGYFLDRTYTLTPDDVVFEDGKITAYTNLTEKTIVIPDNFNGITVTSIGYEAFRRKELFSVGLPSSLEIIKGNAFMENRLATIIFPESVATVESQAFFSNRLTTVNFNNTLTELSNGVFTNNRLANINIPENITKIVKSFQSNYSNDQETTTITLPASYEGKPTTWNQGQYQGGAVVSVDSTYTLDLPYTLTINDVEFENGVIKNYTGSETNIIIPETLDGQNVIKIDYAAFKEKQLSSVTLPESLRSIGEEAFQNNQLTSITLPNSVLSMKKNAFSENLMEGFKLPTPTIPGKWAYTGGTQNGGITVDDLAVAYTYQADDYQATSNDFLFEGGEIKAYDGPGGNITIPDDINNLAVTSIGISAFKDKKLTNVTIPNAVTSIGATAFESNDLTTLSIGTAVTTIGFAAFKSNQLTSLTLENGIITIAGDAFYENELTSVTIPNTVTTISPKAFQNNQLTSVTIPNSVTSIGSDAFYGNQLTSVTIPNAVTTIGDNAFRYNQLINIEIPNSVTSIGEYAFRDNKLTNVNVPNAITEIGINAFSNNSFDTFKLPDDYLGANYTWNDGAYQGGQDVPVGKTYTLDLPYTLTSADVGLKKGVIAELSRSIPKNIIIPETINDETIIGIGSDAFASQGLTSVVLSDNITTIENGAFKGNNLSNVELGDAVTIIRESAFFSNNLSNITLPEGLLNIDPQAFENNQLTSVTIPTTVTTIGARAFNNNKMVSIEIPAAVTTIGASALSNNELTAITLVEGLETIGANAFDNNDLTNINIPSTVTSIGASAFANNDKLSGFTLPNDGNSTEQLPWGSSNDGAIFFSQDNISPEGFKYSYTRGALVQPTSGNATTTLCVGELFVPITYPGKSILILDDIAPEELPEGLSATINSDIISISGKPTQSGTFNYRFLINSNPVGLAIGTITVQEVPTVSIGENLEICETQTTIELNSGSQNASGVLWSGGNGSFTNNLASNTIYNIAQEDLNQGQITVITETTGSGVCLPAKDTLIISIAPLPGVFAGNDIEQIGSSLIPLSATVVRSDNSAGAWSSSGTGIFDSENSSETSYQPSQEDVDAGAVLLSYTTIEGICEAQTDNLVATLKGCGITIETTILDNKVTFKAINDNPKVIASYKWDFGNGAKGSGKTIEHVYDATGTYNVTCTSQMSNKSCKSESATSITIANLQEEVKTISGTLQINGAPLDYGTVQLFYISENGNYELLNKIEVTPSDNGQYQFENLKASAYHVMVAPAANSTYFDEVMPTFVGGYNDVQQAEKVIVNGDVTDANIDLPTVTISDDNTWKQGEDAYVGTVVFEPEFDKKSGTGRNVRDLFDDPEPVQEAIVLLSNLQNQLLTFASTDAYGEFRFEGLNDGVYNIEISYIGSDARINQEIVIDGDKQTRSDDFFVLKRSNNSGDLQASSEGVNGINNIQAKETLYIFPNPSTLGIFTIADTESTIKNTVVYNTLGQEILRLDTNKTINLSNYPAGNYLVRATLINGQSTVLLIQRQ